MGLTKQYLRYVPGPVFNIIASYRGNAVFVDYKNDYGRYVASAACENVNIWDTRTGTKVNVLQGEKSQVSVISPNPTTSQLAVGYEDGTVRLYDFSTGELLVTFSGHKSSVTCLSFDSQGMRLVSGSRDTNIIVWDIVTEAGLYKLSGHKGPITQCRFLETRNILVSSSKDTLVKFWDLDTQHCFKTVVGHRTEVWDLAVLKDDKYLVTGCSDSELRVWRMKFLDESNGEDAEVSLPEAKKTKQENTEGETETQEKDTILSCEKAGTILRQGRDRVISIRADRSGRVLICHGSDSTVEIFQFHEETEVKKRLGKRLRKASKKQGENVELVSTASLQDEVSRLAPLRASGKVKSVDIIVDKKENVKVLTLLGNNSFEVHSGSLTDKKTAPALFNRLTLPGHRTDVRALSFSSDNIAVASASGESLKIWARLTQTCIRTISCDYALACVFAPGDRHVIVATKTGKLQVFDVAAGRLLEEIAAHQGEVWSLTLTPDQRGLASGGADKTVKFWQFELIPDIQEGGEEATGKRLSLVHTRTLQLEEDVLCVRFSPDQKLVAVSLLDSTVRIFFNDTLKFFLSLYGHKFPVLCMDISYDSTLIITGGADRNVKIWGLDFGDCHKSLFAHDDSVMGLQFVSKTHLFFSCGKDGRVKQWDADNFEKIVALEGHAGEVWALSVSADGKFVVSSGHDRSLRLWERTSEPLVLEDERETEREKESDEALATGEDRVIPGQKADEEATLPGRKTAETERAAERLMEAMDVHESVTAEWDQYRAALENFNNMDKKQKKKEGAKAPAEPQQHPLMMAYGSKDPDRFLMEILRRIKSSELEEALLVLPLHYVSRLLKVLDGFLKKGWDTELVMRVVLFLLRLHQGPLVTSPALLPVVRELRVVAGQRVDQLRDTVGFNLAGLQLLQREMEEREAVQLFAEATDRVRQKRRKQKMKDKAAQRAVLML